MSNDSEKTLVTWSVGAGWLGFWFFLAIAITLWCPTSAGRDSVGDAIVKYLEK